jgi:hypothetical protein
MIRLLSAEESDMTDRREILAKGKNGKQFFLQFMWCHSVRAKAIMMMISYLATIIIK